MLKLFVSLGVASLLLQDAVANMDHDHMDMTPAPSGTMDSTMGSMDMSTNVATASTDACVVDPTTADCAAYELPEEMVHSGHSAVCSMMPFMTGCSLHEACEAGSMGEGNPYCDPFSLLATMCNDAGMQGMGGCTNYAKLCNTPGSVVEQCTAHPPVPSMLNTTDTQVRGPHHVPHDACNSLAHKLFCSCALRLREEPCLFSRLFGRLLCVYQHLYQW